MMIYLSHFLSEETPLYGGTGSITFRPENTIAKGASSNTCRYSFSNHSGTHIDFPLHFSNNGKSLNHYQPSDWIFSNVYVISIPVEMNQIIGKQHIRIEEIPENTDLLLLVTGFGKFRKDEIYWKNNPGLASSLAGAMKERCQNLRAIGFDFISLSSFQNRRLGRIAHNEFLINSDILIIEDMKLDDIGNHAITRCIALPLQVENADGGPISVIAELSND
jgi:arylformamidase